MQAVDPMAAMMGAGSKRQWSETVEKPCGRAIKHANILRASLWVESHLCCRLVVSQIARWPGSQVASQVARQVAG